MAAFDVLNCNTQKMLFIVQREDILRDAMKTFRKLAKNRDKTMGLFTGNKKDLEADYLFSTIQSMNINLEEFDENQFEYIVIDEDITVLVPVIKGLLIILSLNFC